MTWRQAGYYATVLVVPTSGPILVRPDGTTGQRLVNAVVGTYVQGDRVVVIPTSPGSLMCAIGKVR